MMQETNIHKAYDVYSFWNETYCQHYSQWATGLLRFPTFSADPITSMQPEPIYYIMRTLATVMDQTIPKEIDVEFKNMSYNLEYYVFESHNGKKMLAVWLKGYPTYSDKKNILLTLYLKMRKAKKQLLLIL